MALSHCKSTTGQCLYDADTFPLRVTTKCTKILESSLVDDKRILTDLTRNAEVASSVSTVESLGNMAENVQPRPHERIFCFRHHMPCRRANTLLLIDNFPWL